MKIHVDQRADILRAYHVTVLGHRERPCCSGRGGEAECCNHDTLNLDHYINETQFAIDSCYFHLLEMRVNTYYYIR